MFVEYLIPHKHTLKILCKSIHIPQRYNRKREWMFFSEHSVYIYEKLYKKYIEDKSNKKKEKHCSAIIVSNSLYLASSRPNLHHCNTANKIKSIQSPVQQYRHFVKNGGKVYTVINKSQSVRVMY